MQATSSGLQLINGDFEQGFQYDASVLQPPYEHLFGYTTSGAEYISQTRVAGWKTTATDGIVEIWYNGYSSVVANTGRCHAELNADQVSALYQDIDTIPGMLLYWSLAHRGRVGVDVMELRIGPPNATVRQQTMTDGNAKSRSLARARGRRIVNSTTRHVAYRARSGDDTKAPRLRVRRASRCCLERCCLRHPCSRQLAGRAAQETQLCLARASRRPVRLEKTRRGGAASSETTLQ